MAGTIIKYSETCLSVFNTSIWIIDSGASEHMCFDSNIFVSLSPLHVPLHINLPNSFTVTVTHIGKVSILPGYILENVLHVPTFRYNLLSVNRFKCILAFSSTLCMLWASSMNRGQVFGEPK